MQLFSADATMFSIFFFFFAHKKLKKPPSKVAHNWPKPFIPQPSPTHSQQPKINFSYHKNVPPTISSLICGLQIRSGRVSSILSNPSSKQFLVALSLYISNYQKTNNPNSFCPYKERGVNYQQLWLRVGLRFHIEIGHPN